MSLVGWVGMSRDPPREESPPLQGGEDVKATNTGDDAFDGVLEVQVTVSGEDGEATFTKTSGVRIPGGESETYTTEFSAPGATSRSDVTSVNVEFSTSA
jgi:hypothetical protein